MSEQQTRVALYARCSTNEDKQEAENQLIQLREAAKRRGWQIVQEYVDYVSGRKGREKRPQFDQMLKHASQRQFDVVYFGGWTGSAGRESRKRFPPLNC